MILSAEFLDQFDLLADWGLVATDADLIVTFWNRWLERHSGLTADNAVGRRLLELFPGYATSRLEKYYTQAISGQTVVLSQKFHQFILPLDPSVEDSGLRWMQQSGRIVPITDGSTVRGTLTVVEDVTERVIQESQLRNRARRQEALAAMAQSALAGSDFTRLAVEVVAAVQKTLLVDVAEVLEVGPEGGHWNAIARVGPRISAKVACDSQTLTRLLSSLDSGAPATFEDLASDVRFNSDGREASRGLTSGLAVRISGQDRRSVGLLMAFSGVRRRFGADEIQFAQALADVLGVAAERKRLERELHLLIAELGQADRRKNEFLAMLAHELRNPLAPIRNSLQVMRLAGDNSEAIERSRDMVDRQVLQMVRLVDDLLDVSRISRDKMELRSETVDLAVVLATALETSRPAIEHMGHEIEVTLPPESILLLADPMRLAQVFSNLLNNSAKYTERGGRIELTIERKPAEVWVRVKDNGIGIPAAAIPRLFEMFSQVDLHRERAQGGLGIGLNLVKRLVEMHGGTVEAFSAGSGCGSEFLVRLPLSTDSSLSAILPGGESGVPPRPANLRVLVVDDNADSAQSLGMMLELMGCEVSTASDGMSAVGAASSFRPEIILLDIGLPKMNGYEACRRIRELPSGDRIVIVAQTGWGQDEDQQRSREAGFDSHMVKPLNPKALEELLNRYSARYR